MVFAQAAAPGIDPADTLGERDVFKLGYQDLGIVAEAFPGWISIIILFPKPNRVTRFAIIFFPHLETDCLTNTTFITIRWSKSIGRPTIRKLLHWKRLSPTTMKNKYFDFLIETGRRSVLPEEKILSDNGLTSRVLLPDGWSLFDDSGLIALFKGIVILEEYWFTTEGHIGSTTDTKFVYHEILARGIDPDYQIGNWAYQYSSNPYVPMDSGNRHGTTTIQELLSWRAAFADRVRKEKEESIIKKAEKKKRKSETHAERLKRKEIRDRELGYKK